VGTITCTRCNGERIIKCGKTIYFWVCKKCGKRFSYLPKVCPECGAK
jgi:transcription elongation factor Elf1